MSLLHMLVASGGAGVSGEPAESVDLDGTNDFFSRSSDLVGNSNGKTFTASFFVYRTDKDIAAVYQAGSDARLYIGVTSSGISVTAKNTSGATILTGNFNDTLQTFGLVHIILSVDLTDTSRRHIYMQDVAVPGGWGTYTNQDIDFTQPAHSVGADTSGSSKLEGRITNLYFDKVYRDLSQANNRRLFTTLDPERGLIPVRRLQTLNPILYLPVTDQQTAHINPGTGGNLTLNGVVGRSGRGPNQYNNTFVSFGSSQYIETGSALSNVSGDRTELTYCVNFVATTGTTYSALNVYDNTNSAPLIRFNTTTGEFVAGWSNGSAQSIRLQATPASGLLVPGRHYQFAISVDLTDTSRRRVRLNGVDITSSITWATYSSSGYTINRGRAQVSRFITTNHSFEGGDVYFDDSYVDLSTENPFWNSDDGRPLYLGAQGQRPTGSQSLVYLPLRRFNHAQNLGNAFSAFSAQGGTPTSVRSNTEYWAGSASVDGSNYLTGNVVCASLVKWLSTDNGASWNASYQNNVTVTDIGNGADNGLVAYYFGTSEVIDWTQEANRLRFTDGLGYPLLPVQDNNTVLLLDFSDPSNLGNNKAGTNFTVTGSPTAAQDVLG